METYRAEILETEKAFAELVQKQGLKAAFLFYAADEAVLHRGNELIQGKEAIGEYFERQTLRNVRLEWTPDFVEVAAAGDLGYTYGRYAFEGMDETGKTIQAEGIFHTVWKRQPNGKWHYVWD